MGSPTNKRRGGNREQQRKAAEAMIEAVWSREGHSGSRGSSMNFMSFNNVMSLGEALGTAS